MVDCAKTSCYGCNGGWPYAAMDYTSHTGLDLESSYPYTAKDGSCHASGSGKGKLTGHATVQSNNHNALLAAVNTMPVSVLIEADQSAF